MIDPEFLLKLNRLNQRVPGSVSSLARTATHNAAVGGATKSGHVYGTEARPWCVAADLIYDHPDDLPRAAQAAIDLGFTGVELDLTNTHLHVDCLPRLWHVVYHGTTAGQRDERPLVPHLRALMKESEDV